MNRTITLLGFPAGQEFRVKTTAPNQLWPSDASCFFVVGWGWYYSIEVLDDFSGFVLASNLKPDMTANSISDMVEHGASRRLHRHAASAGRRPHQVAQRSRFRLPGAGLRGVSVHAIDPHIDCAPHHPQTNGKIERFHETLKARMNLLVYTSPEELRRTMQEFIEYYNYHRYHEAIGNLTPADVHYGRREQILRRREEQKQRTIEERLRYNLSRSNLKLTGELKSKV